MGAMLVLLGCGGSNDGTDAGATDAPGSSASEGSEASSDSASSESTASETSSAGSSSTAASTSGDASSSTTQDPTDSGGSDTVGGGLGPIELYRGPVTGGSVPGWDPDNPRPLLMMGRLGNDWVATLARLGDDGALSDNAAEEIIVWGFETAPPLLYDGPVGGTLDAWDASDPTPLVMLGFRESDGAWWSTLSTIGPDGATGTNAADRIIVWGWPDGDPTRPAIAYAGPLDANAVVSGWDENNPEPLVLMGTFTGTGIWQSTLASVSPSGELTENLANEIRVWSWP